MARRLIDDGQMCFDDILLSCARQDNVEQGTGYLYIMMEAGCTHGKIGISVNPLKRRGDLQDALSTKLYVIGAEHLRDPRAAELDMQQFLASYRCVNGGSEVYEIGRFFDDNLETWLCDRDRWSQQRLWRNIFSEIGTHEYYKPAEFLMESMAEFNLCASLPGSRMMIDMFGHIGPFGLVPIWNRPPDGSLPVTHSRMLAPDYRVWEEHEVDVDDFTVDPSEWSGTKKVVGWIEGPEWSYSEWCRAKRKHERLLLPMPGEVSINADLP